MIRILLLCEIHRHREALSRALCKYPDIDVCHTTGSAGAALAFAERMRPDLLLIDTPSNAVADEYARCCLPCPVLWIGNAPLKPIGDPTTGLEVLPDPNPSLDDLYRCILSLVIQNSISDDERRAKFLCTSALKDRSAASTITTREREIWALVARGLSNKEIGAELYISTLTVKNHVRRVLSKLSVKRRAQLIGLWLQDVEKPTGRGSA